MLLLVLSCALVPFAVLWCGAVLLTDALARRGARRPRPVTAERAPRRTDAASIMVLNWNGREFLADLLPSLRAAVARHGGDHEVIVIDNGSADDSVAFVRAQFPEVQLVCHPENRKFVRGYNDAFEHASRDIVVLLNNDMVVDEGFLGPLLEGFADPRTFAVSAQISMADPAARRVETGLTGGYVSAGILKLRHDEVPDHVEGLVPVLWAGGGSTAFDRRRLLELGGFDPLYDPFYFEDTGLSFEAWKRGDHVLLAPAARATHVHQGSSSRLPAMQVQAIRRRNQHLFCWRHLTDPRHAVATTLLLPLNVVRLALANRGASLLRRALVEARGVAAAVPRLPAALRGRAAGIRRAVRTDAEVFTVAHSRHVLERHLGLRPPRAGDPADGGPKLRILMLAARVPKRGVDGSWGLYELIRVLGRRHEVTLFTLMDQQDDERHLAALQPFVRRLEGHRIQRDVGDLDLHHRIPPRLRKHYTSPALRGLVGALLRTESFDLLQVDYVEMAALVDRFIGGVRSVHVVHEPLFRMEQLRRVGGVIPHLVRSARYAQAVNYEARLYPRFSRVVCLTPEDEAHIRRWVPSLRTAVNPMGADIERIQPAPPSAGHVMLSVGYMGHPPNVDAAFWFVRRVLPLVRAEVPDARVRMVGAGTAELTELAEHDGVELAGYVEDLDPEMAGCALTLAPIREGGGLRTKVLESFAYGRTMVATPIAMAGIEARDGEHLRVAADARGFAAACVALLRDDDLRRRMEAAGRALVLERYTNEQMARRAEAIYREVIGS